MNKILQMLTAAIVPSICCCLLVPMMNLFHFSEEFIISWRDAAWFYSFYALISMTTLAALFHFFKRYSSWLQCIVLAITLMLLLENSILSLGLPILNGQMQYYGTTQRMVWDSLIWLVVICAAIFFRKWIQKKYPWMALIVLVIGMLLVVEARGTWTSNSLAVENESSQMLLFDEFHSPDDVLASETLSSKGNVFLFIVDSCSSEVGAEVFEENEFLRDQYAGFLNFTNTIGLHEYTMQSIPAIFQGRLLDDYSKTASFFNDILSEKSMLAEYFSALNNSYFTMTRNVAFSSPLLGKKTISRQRNARRGTGFFNVMLEEIAIFRSLPYVFKRPYLEKIFVSGVENGLSAIDSSRTVECATSNIYGNDDAVYERLSDLPVEGNGINLHAHLFYGTHPPILLDDNGNRLPSPAFDRDSYKRRALLEFKRIARMMESLREKKLFDDSVIILCGDHSIGYLKDDLMASAHGNAFPLFLVKPKKAKSRYRSVKVPTSLLKVSEFVKLYSSPNFSPSEDEVIRLATIDNERTFRLMSDDSIIDYVFAPDKSFHIKKSETKKTYSMLNPLQLNVQYNFNPTESPSPDFLYDTEKYNDINQIKRTSALQLRYGSAAFHFKTPDSDTSYDVTLRGMLSFYSSTEPAFDPYDYPASVECDGKQLFFQRDSHGEFEIHMNAVKSDENGRLTIGASVHDNLPLELFFFSIELNEADNVKQINYPETISLPRKISEHLANEAIHGYVDSVEITKDGYVYVSGWSFDSETMKNASLFSVEINGKPRFLIQDGKKRNDVAHALGSDSARDSGFVIYLATEPSLKKSIGVIAGGMDNAESALSLNKTITEDPDLSAHEAFVIRHSDTLLGWVDVFAQDKTPEMDVLTFRGWAADREQGAPVGMLRVLLNDSNYSFSRVVRKDVAAALKTDKALDAGFHIKLPMPAEKIESIQVRAGNGAGSQQLLTNNHFPITKE